MQNCDKEMTDIDTAFEAVKRCEDWFVERLRREPERITPSRFRLIASGFFSKKETKSLAKLFELRGLIKKNRSYIYLQPKLWTNEAFEEYDSM